MSGRRWMAVGASWAAAGVALGAFGAHALRERLEAAGELANWETAVRYQMWHALALVLFGLWRERAGGPAPGRGSGGGPAGWAFLVGSLLFSGSIYLLALDVLRSVVWPLTPLGGLLLILGWLAFARAALRGPDAD